jgi:hypothetical protein
VNLQNGAHVSRRQGQATKLGAGECFQRLCCGLTMHIVIHNGAHHCKRQVLFKDELGSGRGKYTPSRRACYIHYVSCCGLSKWLSVNSCPRRNEYTTSLGRAPALALSLPPLLLCHCRQRPINPLPQISVTSLTLLFIHFAFLTHPVQVEIVLVEHNGIKARP